MTGKSIGPPPRMETLMKIGIIGSGNMGRAIGVRLARLGHDVMFGARRPEQSQQASNTAAHGTIGGNTDEAARFGDILVWTIRTPDPSAVFADAEVIDGKIVIDLNNRDYANDVKGKAWFDAAIAEQLQAAAPKARIVKALNTIAMETFDTSAELLRSAGAQTFLAGDDPSAKSDVGDLMLDLGFEPVDLGAGVAAMRAAEALGDVIRLLMIDGGYGGRAHLSLTRLPDPDLATIGERQASSYH
ncbi:MAG: NAD(P)-binding domain-containing protein [Pseudomonadota bacterium]